jgi:hypothetical protein
MMLINSEMVINLGVKKHNSAIIFGVFPLRTHMSNAPLLVGIDNAVAAVRLLQKWIKLINKDLVNKISSEILVARL